jgi:superfamily I DNA/RNA helicase
MPKATRPGHTLEGMADHGDDGIEQALSLTRKLLTGELVNNSHENTSTLVVTGPPCSGKTSFALASLLDGIEMFGVEGAVMVVSGRQAAANMSRKVIEARGAVDRSRPVGTLSALAFRLLAEDHAARHLPAPKLLNGAEQEALLRQVLAEHVSHVLKGDSCQTCNLLRRYYGDVPTWINLLTGRDLGSGDDQNEAARHTSLPSDRKLSSANTRRYDDITFLSQIIRADFVAQLRDTIARVNELGLDFGDENDVVHALYTTDALGQERSSLELQWRLSFRIWREYAEHIETRYRGEARLDSSHLLVQAAQAVRDMHADTVQLQIPQLLVVDDWQDVTLAGMALLQALSNAGCRLLLVGNSDEAVQIFRGSYPEYLDSRITTNAEGHEWSTGDGEAHGADGRTRQSYLFANADMLARLGAARAVLHARPLLSTSSPAHGETRHASRTQGTGRNGARSYLDVVAARVSLGIPSEEQEVLAVPMRPGKLPQWEGTLPIRALDADNGLSADGSVAQHLFHTPEEELAHIVWQIKHESLSEGRDWNDMAVIAHDNATIESYGRRLREEGVPVRYSSITRPLKEEPVIQGLFALVELAERRRDSIRVDAGYATSALPDADTQAQWIRTKMRAVLSSPLIVANSSDISDARPVRLERLDMLMDSCVALAKLKASEQDLPSADEAPAEVSASTESAMSDAKAADNSEEDHGEAAGRLPQEQVSELSNASILLRAWQALQHGIDESRQQRFREQGIIVDDSLTESLPITSGKTGTLSRSSLYAVLLLSPGDEQNCLLTMMAAIASNSRHDPDVEALRHLCDILRHIDEGLAALESLEPQYVLWQAWDACGLAEQWQRESLEASHRGELANDRLDAVMRLFQFASGEHSFTDADAFIAQVRGMQIEADSLAHIGPVEHAVTLTTPAGAAAEARRWPLVWLPAVQEGVWPNVTQRDTLFSTEDLADLVMRLHDAPAGFAFSSASRRLRGTLHAEKKNLLMALTRASQRVVWSAVWNDDMVPSDFFFGYLPELCPRVQDRMEAQFTSLGDAHGEVSQFAGLELSPRGLITVARSVLLRESSRRLSTENSNAANCDAMPDDPHHVSIEDAIRTLRLLGDLGYESADPDTWAFIEGNAEGSGLERSGSEGSRDADRGDAEFTACATVTLSPSAVDSIWECPLEWAVGRQLSGPQPGSIYMSFGSLVHHVAQLASEQGLDDAQSIHQSLQGQGESALIAATADEMMTLYGKLSGELSSPPDFRQSYDLMRRDANARNIMSNIASYFVRSVQKDYAQVGKTPIDVGRLEGAECELPFTATITVADVLAIWNASFGDDCPMTLPECFAVMSALVSGFPEALNDHVAVRLSGRIDRLEHRVINGEPVIRLVDYKTGSTTHPRAAVFSDLQLVCYQLGQYFGEGCEKAPNISQAVLFDVANAQAPATSRTEESSYQPALIRDGRFNTVFAPRNGSPRIDSSYTADELPEKAPAGISDRTWNFVRQQSGQQGIWALTMISRVFYAAGVKLSLGSDTAQFDAARCHNGGAEGCPAWKALHGSVMEDER